MNKLIIFIPLIIGLLTSSKPDSWYNNLKKSNYIPPPYVFGIVWTFLYLSIGTAYYIALKNKKMIYWLLPIIHLLFNFSYSVSLFKYRLLRESMLICFSTLFTGLIITYLFSVYDKSYISVYLMIPYLLWLSFACFLSYNLYKINK
jgi:benzodiazapine receptor